VFGSVVQRSRRSVRTSSCFEISHGLFGVHITIIWRGEFDFPYILFQERFVITDTFDKHAFASQSTGFEHLQYMGSSGFGRIGGVKGGDAHSVLLHVLEEVGQSSVAGLVARQLSSLVGGIVEIGRHLRAAQLATIVTNVEYLRRNVVKKGQETTNAFGNVGFAYMVVD
jgi:hypothetical protein